MGENHIVIKAVHVERAAARAKDHAERKRDSEFVQWTDESQSGLVLRLRGKKVTWIVKHAGTSAVIGVAFPANDRRKLTAPAEARVLAGRVKALIDDDRNKVDAYLTAHYAGATHEEALAGTRPAPTTWTFQRCVEAMVEDRSDPSHKKHIRPSTKKDIETTFNRECLADIKAKPAAALTRAEFESARDTIRKDAGISPAQKFVAWTRSVLSYMAEAHSGESGIDGRDPWWQFLQATHAVSAKTRSPEVSDIVKTLRIAEGYLDRPLPGRSITKSGIGAGVLAGLWWIVLTCQRGDAALSLKTYNLMNDAERGEGWKIAAWEDEVMKAGQAQLLPIPPRAAAHIEAIRAKAKHHGSKQWAFPSDRDADKHATLSGVYRILYRLAGRDEVEQKRPEGWQPPLKKDGTPRKLPERTERRGLLAEAGVEWWSGHDVRRRLQSALDLAGIPGGSSVVLAHQMKTDVDLTLSMTQQQREDFMRQRQARITAQAYGGANFLKLKAEAMQVWTDAVLDEYDRQKAG